MRKGQRAEITPWPDTPLFEGIKNFQADNKLKIDGLMKPGGPTERMLGSVLDRRMLLTSTDSTQDKKQPIAIKTMEAKLKLDPQQKQDAPAREVVPATHKDKPQLIPMQKTTPPQSPIDSPIIRNDDRGKGHYGANREDGRKHKGIDIEVKPGTAIKSPIAGKVEIRNAYLPKADKYNGKYKNVWVIDEDGNQYGLGYVSPKDADGKTIVQGGQKVKAGETVGIIQNRAGEDKDGIMKSHMHFMRKDKNGKYMDPTKTVNQWIKKTPEK